jgi:predicted TIM-barrel fold metal-dependent hydrolase
MNLLPWPKIDCHHHVFDPARFAYAEDTAYRPEGHELGTPDYYHAVMDAYGIGHSLIVGPTSAYGTDNRLLLATLAEGAGRHKGIAVVPRDISSEALAALQAQGVVGVALNVAMLGVEPFLHCDPLLGRLGELGMLAQIQVQSEQLSALLPLLARNSTRLLIDHSGRPDVVAGLRQPAFQALLGLAEGGRTWVKLSGMGKFTLQGYPFSDTRPYQQALLQAFGAERCLWGSDWPFLRADQRMDLAVLLGRLAELVGDEARCRQILWGTPKALFAFGS